MELGLRTGRRARRAEEGREVHREVERAQRERHVLDEPDDDYEPTFLARLRMRFAGRRKMARIKKSAKEIILSQFRETEDERVQKELEQQEEAATSAAAGGSSSAASRST